MNLKTRWEETYDIAEYVHKLDPEAKAWMNKFMGEYVGASLDTEDLSNNLHNTPALKKSCFDRNNARNRCIYTKQKAMGNLVDLESIKEAEQLLDEVGIDFEAPEDKSSNKADRSEDS